MRPENALINSCQAISSAPACRLLITRLICRLIARPIGAILFASSIFGASAASSLSAQALIGAGKPAGGRFFHLKDGNWQENSQDSSRSGRQGNGKIRSSRSSGADSRQLSGQEGGYRQTYALLGIRLPRINALLSKLATLNLTRKEKENILRRAGMGIALFREQLRERRELRLLEPTNLRDFAGRHLAMVEAKKGKSLNLLLVERGYAYPRWRELKHLKAAEQRRFQQALQNAIRNRLGLWQLWQRRQREERSILSIDRRSLPYRQRRRLTLMTYNVENLFDTYDSPDNLDSTFLPLAEKKRRAEKHLQTCKQLRGLYRRECLELDWNENLLKIKMERLAKVILKFGSSGPDILFLQEIENYALLRRFRDQYLKKSSYRIIHFESRDRRGIDVAILTRLLPAALPEYYEIEFRRQRRTRGILHAPLLLPDGNTLHAFVFHFPSQYSPTPWRQDAIRFLSLLRNKASAGEHLIAAGDCNITQKEEPLLYPHYLQPFWKISPQEGCRDCRGTSYYPPQKSWSFFDLFYYSQTLQEGEPQEGEPKERGAKKDWHVVKRSIQIFNPLPFQNMPLPNGRGKRPRPYRWPHFSGVSDHWPAVLELAYR